MIVKVKENPTKQPTIDNGMLLKGINSGEVYLSTSRSHEKFIKVVKLTEYDIDLDDGIKCSRELGEHFTMSVDEIEIFYGSIKLEQ